MLRVSFFTRQVSKRLVTELSAMNAAMGAAGAKPKKKLLAKRTNNNTTSAPPAAEAPAETTAAAVQARTAAEDALRVKPHKDAAPERDTSAADVPKKMKKKKMKRAAVAVVDVKTSGDTTAPAVASTREVERTPAPEVEAQKKDDPRGSCDDCPKDEGRVVEKKKKKKMLKLTSSFRSVDCGKEKKPPAAAAVPAHEPPAAAKAEERQKEEKEESTTATSSPPLKAATAVAAPPHVANQEKAGLSQQKTPMIKAFRIGDVLAACTASDGVFARRLPQGGCQFFAWPGTPLAIASNAVSTMPDTIRTVHAIFGREKTPIDLVLDIDCPVPQEHWSMHKIRPFQKKLLGDVMSVVVKEIEAIGEKIASQVVLQSPNLKKASFHVHTKLQDAAFEDYNSLHGFLYRFHKKIPNVDLQIYRPNGMLRMHRCMKENHTSAMTVFEDSQWNIGFPNGVVPDSIAALHSACVRESGTYSRLLHFDAPRSSVAHEEVRGNGNDNSAAGAARAPCVLLPRTEREAVENVSKWLRVGSREADVGEWRAWIGLGINAYRVAYQFRDAQTLKRPAMEELLEAWVEASKKCPTKFRRGACESKWASFDINRLTKVPDNDWWPSYVRIGRMAMMNEAADAAASSETSRQNERT